ncbi:hypothetical protein [Nocardia arthritidis]|uniref:hypothetical protein n=1 Tax=Nocardia arthritidis TaxID=228602 RepID=UPI0014723E38|nr:hypothetical protein [Nocardia arthritidis]
MEGRAGDGRKAQAPRRSYVGAGKAGLDERSIIWQLALFRLIRDGGNAVVTDTVERITGHPARDLKSYARENAATWR